MSRCWIGYLSTEPGLSVAMPAFSPASRAWDQGCPRLSYASCNSRLLSTEISNHEPTRKPIRLPLASVQHRQPGPRLQRRPGPHGLLNIRTILILSHLPTARVYFMFILFLYNFLLGKRERAHLVVQLGHAVCIYTTKF